MLRWFTHQRKAWIKGKRGDNRFPEPREKTAGDMPSRLLKVGQELQAISESVEPVFLKLGGELQEVYSGASEMTVRTMEAVESISGKTDKAILSRVGNFAQNALEKLRACKEDVISKLGLIQVVAEKLHDLNSACEVIENIARYLRVVGLNIGIECSRSMESSEKFGVVVEEIRSFVEKVIGVAAEIRMDSGAAQITQISSHQQISEGLTHLSDLACDAEASVREGLGKIEELMKSSAFALEEGTAHSREISRQVGEVVVGIQFQDNMKQRVEHITDALHDAAGLCAKGLKESASKADQEESLGAAHAIILLQSAQLEQVIAEVDQVYRNAVEAFAIIGEEVGKLGHGLAVFGMETAERSGEYETKKGDSFTSLIQGLDHLHQLVDQGWELMKHIEKAITSATETANKLTERTRYVRTISFETQRMAINAVIKATHLGDGGRTLEILAQEVSGLSDRTNEFVEGVEAIIEAIALLARELTASTRENEMRAFSENRDVTSVNSGSHEISIAYDHFRKDSSEALGQATVLEDMISQTSSGLDFLQDLREDLGEKLKELNVIGDLLAPWGKTAASDSFAEAEKIGQRYTMQQERDIHERISEGKGQGDDVVLVPLALVIEAGTGKEENEQENRVELFSDEAGCAV